MTDNLKPCPFCGKQPRFERVGTPRASCIIECGWCGCRLETSEEGDECGNQWNDRTEPAGSAEPSNDVLKDALNTVLWLERRLPKGYGEVPHVQRTIAALNAALSTQSTHQPDVSIKAGEIDMEKEREAFEAWAASESPSLERWLGDEGAYVNRQTQTAWFGWQARALLAAKGGE